jgi:hypothetical protein
MIEVLVGTKNGVVMIFKTVKKISIYASCLVAFIFFLDVAGFISLGYDGSPVELEHSFAKSLLDGTASKEEWDNYFEMARRLAEPCLRNQVRDYELIMGSLRTGPINLWEFKDRFWGNTSPVIPATTAIGGQVVHMMQKISITQKNGEYYMECIELE